MVGLKAVEGLKEDEIKLMHRDHAWFVAYAPAENSRIAVSVIVEHGEHGSTAAAPIAKELITAYLKIGEQETALSGSKTGVRAARSSAAETGETRGEAAPSSDKETATDD